MRRLVVLAASALTMQSADAQQSFLRPTIGPTFSESAVNAERFDAVFTQRITLVPAIPLLIGQSSEARYDAVVCNAGSEGPGWVKANSESRFGVLEPGVCTMFSNFSDLQLTTPGSNEAWTAKVFLRSHR